MSSRPRPAAPRFSSREKNTKRPHGYARVDSNHSPIVYIHTTIYESFVERESRGDNMMGGGDDEGPPKICRYNKNEKKK